MNKYKVGYRGPMVDRDTEESCGIEAGKDDARVWLARAQACDGTGWVYYIRTNADPIYLGSASWTDLTPEKLEEYADLLEVSPGRLEAVLAGLDPEVARD